MQERDLTNFEFTLKLGDYFIIQRIFNVYSYNPNTKKSLELYDTITGICDTITNDLKIKNLIYMSDNSETFSDEPEDDTEGKNYSLQLKLGEDVIIEKIFPANFYHPKVRKNVDIRPMVGKMLYDLTKVLSTQSKYLTLSYLNQNL